MTKRFDYLDIAKGVGILLVVWAHIMLVGWTHKVIYAFHMPLFFFISGMLFKKDKYESFGKFLKVRAKRLLVPYIIYSVVTWCVWAGFRYIRHDEVDSYLMPLLQTFIAQGSGEFMVHNSALWFVPCLFAVEIMYYLFSRFREPVTLLLCFITAGVGAALMYIYGNEYMFLLPWNLDAAFYALPFYGVANSIMRHTSHEQVMGVVSNNTLISLWTVVALFGAMSILALCYGECSMGSSSYSCPLWVFFVRAFLGCFGLVAASALVCTLVTKGYIYESFKWFGKNSLDVMCLHIPIKGIAVIVVAMILKLTVDIQASAMYSCVAFVLTLMIMTPIIWGVNKYIRK